MGSSEATCVAPNGTHETHGTNATHQSHWSHESHSMPGRACPPIVSLPLSGGVFLDRGFAAICEDALIDLFGQSVAVAG